MNIQDGKATFVVRDKRLQALFDMIHPVGSVYTTIKDGKPFELGTWQEVGQGRVLQGVGNGQTAGTTVEAGLPNITGGAPTQTFNNQNDLDGGWVANGNYTWGAVTTKTWSINYIALPSGGTAYDGQINIDASKANAIYGKSNTVQPPAYLVHFWVRTA